MRSIIELKRATIVVRLGMSKTDSWGLKASIITFPKMDMEKETAKRMYSKFRSLFCIEITLYG